MFYATVYTSPIGKLTLASDGTNLTGLWVEDQKHYGKSVAGESVERDDLKLFGIVQKWLDKYFAGKKPAVTQLPLAPAGSQFRQAVWEILRRIPYGEVVTYGAIAQEVARARGLASMSSQAVGGAVGHNPISIIIPCHRVIGAQGNLTGYASGIARKIQLLELEGVDTAKFFIPGRGTAL